MKTIACLFVTLGGIILVCLGHSALARLEAGYPLRDKVRVDMAKFDAEMDAKYPSQADDKFTKPFKAAEERMQDYLEEKSASTTGTIQYCTGYLLIAFGLITFCSKPNIEK